MKKKFVHIGIVSFWIIIFMGIVSWAWIANAKFALKKPENYEVHIYPQDKSYITEKEVVELIKKYDIKDTNDVVRSRIVESRLEQHPFIDNAEAYINTKGKLAVEITQFEPWAYVDFGSYRKMMDKKGYIKPVPAREKPELPVIFGIYSDRDIRELYPLIKDLKQDSFYHHRIKSIALRRNGIYLKLNDFAPEINLGGMDAYRTKLGKAKDMIRVLNQQKKTRLYKQVDVSYQGQIICKK